MKSSKVNNVLSFSLMFIAPLVVIFRRYQGGSHTVTVDEGMGFFATALIMIVVFAIVYMLIFHLKELMRKSFRLTILIGGVVAGGLISATYFATNYISNMATSNYDKFIEVVNYHMTTMYIMLIFIVGGLLLASGEYILKLGKYLTNVFNAK